jgi:hypothetical protein
VQPENGAEHRFATQSVALTLLIPAIDVVHNTKAGCSPTLARKKDPAAVALGRKGGKKIANAYSRRGRINLRNSAGILIESGIHLAYAAANPWNS